METQFGQYHLLERLAVGGMGEVYLARITRGKAFQKIVAVKTMLPEFSSNPEFVRQFENEARFAARLQHANIVSVYDYGRIGKTTFLAMEYVDGTDLATLIDYLKLSGKTVGISNALAIAASVAQGLDYLHRLRGSDGEPLHLIHQDISPQNILISSEGEVKITDFGLVRALRKSGQPLEGKLLGKLAYMAPEQLIPNQQIDKRADIFALGCVLYEMLTGDFALGEAAHSTDLKKRRTCLERSLSKVKKQIPQTVFQILKRSLEWKKENRYQDAASMYSDLRRELAKLEASGNLPDVASLVRSCPKRRKSANYYIDANRTLVATKPIAKQQRTQSVATKTVTVVVDTLSKRISPQTALMLGVLSAVLGIAILFAIWWFLLPAGEIMLSNIPKDARIFLDGKEIKHSKSEFTLPVYGRSQKHTLRIERQFHKPFFAEFDFEDSSFLSFAPTFEPLFGSIIVETTPSGATVVIDGTHLAQKTPTTIKNIPLGKRISLRLELENFVPFQAEYTLTSTKPLKVQHKFEPLTATLIVNTEPKDAALFINGKRIRGKSPFRIERLSPEAEYRIEVFKRGFEPIVQKLVLNRGENKISVKLKPFVFTLEVIPPQNFFVAIDKQRGIHKWKMQPNQSCLLVVYDKNARALAMRIKAEYRNLKPVLIINTNSRPWSELIFDNNSKLTTPAGSLVLKRGKHTIKFRFLGKGDWLKLILSF